MRSWWRHEQVSIAAAVATALHHSAQRGEGVVRRLTGTEDSGNRRTRPGVLKDPEPQLLDAVLAYRAAGGAVGGHPRCWRHRRLRASTLPLSASSWLLRWRPEEGGGGEAEGGGEEGSERLEAAAQGDQGRVLGLV